MLGLENELKVDVIDLLERKLPKLFGENFNFQILPVSEMGLEHGRTIPDAGMVYIREDVFLGASNGNGRDRATIVHEIGHFILHSSMAMSFARVVSDNVVLDAYVDPEWQAKAFAAEFLVPRNLSKELSPSEIARECGVSLQSAEYQWRLMHQRGDVYGNRQ